MMAYFNNWTKNAHNINLGENCCQVILPIIKGWQFPGNARKFTNHKVLKNNKFYREESCKTKFDIAGRKAQITNYSE